MVYLHIFIRDCNTFSKNIFDGDSISIHKPVAILILITISVSAFSGCFTDSQGSSILIVDASGGADYLNLNQALSAAHAGDIIEVHSGQYLESLNITKSVQLRGVDSSVRIEAVNSKDPVLSIFSDNVTVTGCHIKNGSIGIKLVGNNCTINANYIMNNSIGVSLTEKTKNNLLYDNYFSNNVNVNGSGFAIFNISRQSGLNILGGQFYGGNYWNDYLGFDSNNDGFGDTQIPYAAGLSLGSDWYPLTERKQLPIIYVNDSYNKTTAGWNIDHFTSLKIGVDAVKNHGTLYLGSGTYSETVLINKTVTILGAGSDITQVIAPNNLGYDEAVISILQPRCIVQNLSIIGSDLAKKGVGINIETTANTLSNIVISGFRYGLRFWWAKGENLVSSINITSCHTGLYGSYSYDNKILDSIFSNCDEYGVFLDAGSDRNLIDGNSFDNNEYALRIKGSTLNHVVNNTIKNNQRGMYFCCGARNNTNNRNILINNQEWNANDQYRNIWDLNGIGNYWDDYSGIDSNHDGIGDTGYVITEGYSVDRYPIVDLKVIN